MSITLIFSLIGVYIILQNRQIEKGKNYMRFRTISYYLVQKLSGFD